MKSGVMLEGQLWYPLAVCQIENQARGTAFDCRGEVSARASCSSWCKSHVQLFLDFVVGVGAAYAKSLK